MGAPTEPVNRTSEESADVRDRLDASPKSVLSIRDLRHTFGDVKALDGIDLEIRAGEFVTLLGPSGCGKSTFLRIVAGLEEPDSGSVLVDGIDIAGRPPEQRPVNLVFQKYALFPHLDVWRNIAFGPEVSGVNRDELRRRVEKALAVVQLAEMRNRRPDELSGGQQQRVALARAIVNEPMILLLDEPLGALDLKLRTEMQFEFRAIHRRLGTTFIYVTHDQEEALVMSDRIVVMDCGRIEQIGTPEEIYLHPATRFVAAFIGETNLLEGRLDGAAVTVPALGATFPVAEVREAGPVGVSIRPEHLRAGPQGPVRVQGLVEDAVFMGATMRYVVRLSSGVELIAEEGAGAQRRATRGEEIELSFHPDDAVVVN